MKLVITTTAKGAEVANMILKQSMDILNENPRLKKMYGVSDADLEKVESLRQSLLKSLLTPLEKANS